MSTDEVIKTEFNIPMKMRDGTILRADVYRPDKPGKYPAILTRIPYNKDMMFPIRAGYMNPNRYARAGYAVVVQDVRGTGTSEGDAYFWRQEFDDGYDSVECLAKQPWCDGNVGMFGFSYFGFTQLAAASTQPPHLKAICPGETNGRPHAFPFSLRGDKMRLKVHLEWCLMSRQGELFRRKMPPKEMESLQNQLINLLDNMDDQYRVLPMKDSAAVKAADELGMVPGYADTLAHHDDDPDWQRTSGKLPLEKIAVPVFHMSGWYDVDALPGVLETYGQIKEKGSTIARQNQKLLIGPWLHTGDMFNKVGELDFGLASSGALVDITGIHLRWFDCWLKGVDNSIKKEPPVRIFIMGDNVWRNEPEWPLARTQYTKYYFHSGGQANSRLGDGALGTSVPDDEPYDSYLYDPRNPVPSNMNMGAYTQQEVEGRADVLVYTTEPMNTKLEITGPLEIKLWAASSAVDTDFTGKLIDVWPDGKAYNIGEGIIRAGYRQPGKGRQPIKPGEVYEYSISLGATSNVFKVGHRIRVEISSSNFPKWDRNLNTGNPLGQDAEIKLALQTIYHDQKFPSHIVLPLIPR